MDSKTSYKQNILGNSIGVLTENTAEDCSEVNRTIGYESFDSFSEPVAMNTSFNAKKRMRAESTIEVENLGNCSSSESLVVQSLAIGCNLAYEICISVLKHNRLIGDTQHAATSTPFKVSCEANDNSFMLCKLCGIVGTPRKMLICDLCGEAFHPHCCNEKEPFYEDWYCEPCLSKEFTTPQESGNGKSFANMFHDSRKKFMRVKLGDFLFMLTNTQPHTSKVRIGDNFQAKVPIWSGPVSDSEDCDCFGEPSELPPEEYSGFDGWKIMRIKEDTLGNWIQCRTLMDDEIICGKWRRAPLSVTQTGDWDCSCAVVWDPIHADCAVPQELGTDQVLKKLKYVESLNLNPGEHQT